MARARNARSPRDPVLIGREDRTRARRARVKRIRRARAWVDRLGAVLGLRRTVTVEGVRYREVTRTPIARAMRVAGGKEYDVRFGPGRTGATMRIRCTPDRPYADLVAARRPPLYASVGSLIRPGSRVFELGCGTGAGSRVLGELVGPSGGVVAVDRDRESIRFARRRYRSAHVGFEIGWVETLAGELDGSFDAVLGVDALVGGERADAAVVGELWRVLAPGGRLVLFQRGGPASAWARAVSVACGVMPEQRPPAGDGSAVVIAAKPDDAGRT